MLENCYNFVLYITICFQYLCLLSPESLDFDGKFIVVFTINISQCCDIKQGAEPELNHTNWCVYCSLGDNRPGISMSAHRIRGWTLQENFKAVWGLGCM